MIGVPTLVVSDEKVKASFGLCQTRCDGDASAGFGESEKGERRSGREKEQSLQV